MFQPRVKLEFVKRYLPASSGWVVFVDVDPSEEGRTGGQRRKAASKQRQADMIADFARVKVEVERVQHLYLGQRTRNWKAVFGSAVSPPHGDRDIIGVNATERLLVVAEVEGLSSGQPETKVYKAVGQAVAALSAQWPGDFKLHFGVVVCGDAMAKHLTKCSKLEDLGVFGLRLGASPDEDDWLFGEPCWLGPERLGQSKWGFVACPLRQRQFSDSWAIAVAEHAATQQGPKLLPSGLLARRAALPLRRRHRRHRDGSLVPACRLAPGVPPAPIHAVHCAGVLAPAANPRCRHESARRRRRAARYRARGTLATLVAADGRRHSSRR